MFTKRIPAFFIPAAEKGEQTEYVYAMLAEYHQVPPSARRIWKLRWKHRGIEYQAQVGRRMPQSLAPGEGPVVAILQGADSYLLVSQNRGVLGGEPVKAELRGDSHPTYFPSDPALTGNAG
jgi:hypothetical protein